MANTPNLDSLLARLRNQARQRGLPIQQMLLFYFHERLLARVAHSTYRDQLVLKGGLNLYSRYGASARPTVDIDLLGLKISHQIDDVVRVFGEILQVDLADGVIFDQELSARIIQEEADYPGVRLEPVAHYSTAHHQLQLDMSFGSAVTPGPVELAFPALLGGESHSILGYPLETIIAEKLAAAVELGQGNTRLKDFYDLYWILEHEVLEAEPLGEAIRRSFMARGTPRGGRERILSLVEGEGPELWRRFLRKNPLEIPADFAEVVEAILRRLESFLDAHNEAKS
ncbi:MAG: nucleotidyl transferase AbiEii/AbiGii toxin family protein [Meiothermus sp.]|nr:nucleotidyl transferase AbiEii/AbiGii toxin family protein [Meiothermus sp.]